ncbi:MAG TPA: M13 family metallopeptidase [Chthoniobacterales bacterium]|nr:M13 family metallopeptidase [Chthoniobacterales bacterium]
MMKKSLFVSLLIFAIAFALQAQTEPQKSPPTKKSRVDTKQSNPPPMQTDGAKGATAMAKDENAKPIDQSNFDTSVKPADDFFLYVNGGWIKQTEIPPDQTRWGSFNQLIERNNDALHEIAEKAAKTTSTDADTKKVGDYYASGMDEKAIEAMKTKPLQDELKKIDSLKDKSDVLKEIAHLHLNGVTAFFNFTSSQDDKDSAREIAQAIQGGLGMPDRDYYTKDDDASKKLRDAYIAHVTKMLTLLGEPAAKAGDDAKKIMTLETSLAQASRTRVELRDREKNYNKMTADELQKLTPAWKWTDYFTGIGLTNPGDIDVHQPDFFKAMNTAFTSTSIDDWKSYLRWHLINATASALSNDFVNEDFNFNEKTLRGTEQIKPRWKRVISSENGEIGEALGKLYVAEHFPPAAKARALELINNLKEALADRIKSLDWMDETTKQRALEKLAAFQVKIGYPEKWRDYSTLRVDRGPFVLNELRAEDFESKRQLNKIGKPVDRTEWGMTPPTVNAYYNPKMNEIVFPAGILQPPFFYADADDAVNYGGIGCVIGHEMSHGFDDQGRKYDKLGNLTDWWTKESSDAYEKRRQAVVNQYNEYEALPGLHVNGELTQGENIGDIGGVKIAYAALQKALDKHPENRDKKIDGYTPEQRFFLAYAGIWRSKIRDEEQKLRLKTDPHSPGHFRVNGPLSDLPEFQKAFDIPDGSPMVRAADKRVEIW